MRNKFILTTLLFLLLFACRGTLQAQEDSREAEVKKAIVKIIVTYKKPSYFQPWQMKAQSDRVGSGCVIEGNRILTNAHVVSDQTYIQVLRAGEVEKYTARVEHVAHDCDLALLTVPDEKFFQDVSPVPLGPTPRLRDQVSVYGFPIGGTKLSITEGVVSRIEVKRYSHSDRNLLGMQIDAALNPGNSGGPVIRNEAIVGVAFQVNRQGESLGYVIPMQVIERFLTDVKDGRYDGVPLLGFSFQKLESKILRQSLQMKPDQAGVRMFNLQYGSSVWGHVREGDVLLSINDTDIANDGTVVFTSDERITLSYIVGNYQIGDTLKLRLLRGGSELDAEITLQPCRHLIPRLRYDVRPTYYIFAGLLFLPATENYFHTWREWANVPARLKNFYHHEHRSKEREQVILLSKVMAHGVNLGYHEVDDVVINTINGQTIGSMKDVIKAFEKHQGQYHSIVTGDGFTIVLDAEQARQVSPGINKRHGISTDRSDDLQ